MKYLIFFVLSILLTGLYSCDNRKDIYQDTHKLSLIKLGSSKLLTLLKDSVKGTAAYTCNYSISTQEKLKLNANFIKGKGTFTTSGNIINILPIDTGKSIIEFYVVDDAGATSTAQLELYHFINFKPVAVLKYARIDGQDIYSGSGSYDKDAKFGGKIINYNFVIKQAGFADYTANLANDTMRYNLMNGSTFNISLKVQDNDNEWSDPVSIVVNTP
jgi:hypothetical protein